MCIRDRKTFELALDGVRVPKQNLLGEPGKAFLLMAKGLELSLIHISEPTRPY